MDMTLFGIALWITITATSCDRPECKNTNKIFEQYVPESSRYKKELLRQISTSNETLKYWIGSYRKEKEKEYMTLYVQNNHLCAKSIMDITGAKRLESYRHAKGGGYAGAEIKGLNFRIDSANGGYNFIFESLSSIID